MAGSSRWGRLKADVAATDLSDLLRSPFASSRSLFYYGTFLVVLALVGFPLFFYIWGSFWSTAPGLGGSFTLEGYRRIATSETLIETTWNTFIIAVLGTLVALSLGVTGMFIALKTNVVGGKFITMLFIVQYLLPSFLAAMGWNFWAGPTGLLNEIPMYLFGLSDPPINIYSVWGIALVAGAHYSGLVYLLTSGAIRSIPASLEESSQLSGSSPLRTFLTVTLPLSIPSLGIATVLIFSRLIQSFGVPIILGLPEQIFVIATLMYFVLATPPANFTVASAMGMIILVVSLGGLWLQRRMTGVREKYEVVGGQMGGTESLRFDIGRYKNLLSLFILLLVGIYVMPYLALIFSSFQASYAGLNVLEARWTLANYETIFVGTRSTQFWSAFFNSIIVSTVGAFTGMVISSFASYVIVKSDSPIRTLLDFLSLSPAAIPGIIMATAFLWIALSYQFLGLYGTIWIIMLALTARFIVYGVRATNSSFRGISHELEDAARVSGGNFLQILRDVYLPLIRPGFVSGFILLFVDYLKVLSIPLILQGGNSQMLSVAIWELGANGSDQIAAAVGVVLITLVFIMYLVALLFTERGIEI